ERVFKLYPGNGFGLFRCPLPRCRRIDRAWDKAFLVGIQVSQAHRLCHLHLVQRTSSAREMDISLDQQRWDHRRISRLDRLELEMDGRRSHGFGCSNSAATAWSLDPFPCRATAIVAQHSVGTGAASRTGVAPQTIVW